MLKIFVKQAFNIGCVHGPTHLCGRFFHDALDCYLLLLCRLFMRHLTENLRAPFCACLNHKVMPIGLENLGLQNALTQLLLNQAKHTEEVVEEPTGETETTETETTSSCPGKSCEPHGNGKGHSPH